MVVTDAQKSISLQKKANRLHEQLFHIKNSIGFWQKLFALKITGPVAVFDIKDSIGFFI